MNANEQIKMLRRALEAMQDWYGGKLTVCEFHDKWCPQGMSAGEFTSRTYNEAMLATATPPDDNEAQLIKQRDAAIAELNKFREEIAREFRKHGLAAGPRAVEALIEERDEARKERDKAQDSCLLAERNNEKHIVIATELELRINRLTEKNKDLEKDLAASRKEIEDIYNAKSEPEFRADENRIQQRRLSWCHFATIAPQDGANSDGKAEAIAKRIADALNGVKP